MPEEQKPSVGRIVHFGAKDLTVDVPYDEAKLIRLAAIITLVNEDSTVSLQIFGIWNVSPRNNVPFSYTLEANCWTWPPRV